MESITAHSAMADHESPMNMTNGVCLKLSALTMTLVQLTTTLNTGNAISRYNRSFQYSLAFIVYRS